MTFDQRKDERFDLPCDIEYVLNPLATDEIFAGVAINISTSGICLLVSNTLYIGQEITIISVLPIPSQTATVRWIEKHEEDHYKVGLEFV